MTYIQRSAMISVTLKSALENRAEAQLYVLHCTNIILTFYALWFNISFIQSSMTHNIFFHAICINHYSLSNLGFTPLCCYKLSISKVITGGN